MSVSFIFLVFIVYAFIGWLSEVAYCFIVVEHKLVNRGFLHGPICPVYGFGGLLVVYLLSPYKESLPLLFVMSVVWTTVLEYLTSWALETVFSTKWWDYSDLRFNLNGRICLRNSLLFGVMGILAVYFVHPRVVSFLSLFSVRSLDTVASALGIALAVDVILTLKTLIHLDEKLVALKELTDSLRENVSHQAWFNELDLRGSLSRLKGLIPGDASGSLARISARFEDMLAHSRGTLRIFRAFPTMRSPRHGAQLDLFRKLRDSARGFSFFDAAQSRSEPVSGAEAAPGVKSFVFAERYGFYKVFWIFLVAGFAGVLLESLWCVITKGYFESRTGLVWALFNPVYGLGGVLMAAFFTRREKSRDLRVFVDNVIIGGVFEYCASVFQEIAFGSVSWDYSGMRFGIYARTNLLYAFMWGFLGLLWVREACPALLKLITRIPVKFGKILSIALFVFLLVDSGVSAVAVSRWSARTRGVPAENVVDRLADGYFPDSYMRSKYPNMSFVTRPSAFGTEDIPDAEIAPAFSPAP